MKNEKSGFDFDKFKEQTKSKLQKGDSLLGKEGVLTPLLKEFLEETLEGELEDHLDETRSLNRKNGKGKKVVKTSIGPVEITTPRDRNGTYDPQIVAKRHRSLGVDLDRQIIALYARGSSLTDIRDHLEELYDIEVSTATISRVTDKVLPLLQEWKG